jgi:hypothetical protein
MLPVVTALVAVPPQQVTLLKLARASDRMVLRAGKDITNEMVYLTMTFIYFTIWIIFVCLGGSWGSLPSGS